MASECKGQVKVPKTGKKGGSSDDDWGDTDVNKGDKNNDALLESVSSEGSDREEVKREESKAIKPKQ